MVLVFSEEDCEGGGGVGDALGDTFGVGDVAGAGGGGGEGGTNDGEVFVVGEAAGLDDCVGSADGVPG